ncbi:MAG: sigma-70 family RNA polymerase sigma factor [Planctomycetota bacterium]
MTFPRISSFSDSVFREGSSTLLNFARTESRQLLSGLSLGMPGAESQLVQRFTGPLIRYIRPRIDSRFQHRFTAEDIVQSAFLSFFKRHRKAPYQFEDERSLWSLLCTITMRTLQRKITRLKSKKRNVFREVHQPETTEDSSTYFWQATSRESDPAAHARAADIIPNLLCRLDPLERRILKLKFHGYTNREIALDVQRSTRSVYRTLDKIRFHLKLIYQLTSSAKN